MRSDLMKKGVDRIPHRSLMKALGLTDEEIDRPIIGIVNSFNEIIPGHKHLREICEAVKAGVRMAGGTPIETDGRLMEFDGGKDEGTDLSDPPEEVRRFFADLAHAPVPETMEPLPAVMCLKNWWISPAVIRYYL